MSASYVSFRPKITSPFVFVPFEEKAFLRSVWERLKVNSLLTSYIKQQNNVSITQLDTSHHKVQIRNSNLSYRRRITSYLLAKKEIKRDYRNLIWKIWRSAKTSESDYNFRENLIAQVFLPRDKQVNLVFEHLVEK